MDTVHSTDELPPKPYVFPLPWRYEGFKIQDKVRWSEDLQAWWTYCEIEDPLDGNLIFQNRNAVIVWADALG